MQDYMTLPEICAKLKIDIDFARQGLCEHQYMSRQNGQPTKWGRAYKDWLKGKISVRDANTFQWYWSFKFCKWFFSKFYEINSTKKTFPTQKICQMLNIGVEEFHKILIGNGFLDEYKYPTSQGLQRKVMFRSDEGEIFYNFHYFAKIVEDSQEIQRGLATIKEHIDLSDLE